MSNTNKFQSREEVSQFMHQLQGLLRDPRLADLAEQADLNGGTNLKGELIAVAQAFSQVADAAS